MEQEVAQQLGSKWNYEPWNINYYILKNYTPDFVNEEKKIVIEVKSFFRWNQERQYLFVKDQVEKHGYEYIMALEFPQRKLRKGAKITIAEWCDKHDIRWIATKDLDRET